MSDLYNPELYPIMLLKKACPVCHCWISSGLCSDGCVEDGDNDREQLTILVYSLTNIRRPKPSNASAPEASSLSPEATKKK